MVRPDYLINIFSQKMVYLIPTTIADDASDTIPPYVIEAVRKCQALFVENARTARRFLKKMDPQIVIDDYEWFEIRKNEEQVATDFAGCLRAGKTVGIISEAGCPGVADPGQMLVAEAQKMQVYVKPLTGPSSILLALMASGLNGQHFCFNGYLPIDAAQRARSLRQLDEEVHRTGSTQIFIETPYRNEALFRDILSNCRSHTLVCVAADITSATESIRTMQVSEWKKETPSLHKRPVIFLLGSR